MKHDVVCLLQSSSLNNLSSRKTSDTRQGSSHRQLRMSPSNSYIDILHSYKPIIVDGPFLLRMDELDVIAENNVGNHFTELHQTDAFTNASARAAAELRREHVSEGFELLLSAVRI